MHARYNASCTCTAVEKLLEEAFGLEHTRIHGRTPANKNREKGTRHAANVEEGHRIKGNVMWSQGHGFDLAPGVEQELGRGEGNKLASPRGPRCA